MKIEIDLSEFEVRKIKEIDSDVESFIHTAINKIILKYDDVWKKHIELRIAQLQQELDDHRLTTKDEVTVELDSNVTKRANGAKTPLDSNDFAELQQLEVIPERKSSSKNKMSKIPKVEGTFDLGL